MKTPVSPSPTAFSFCCCCCCCCCCHLQNLMKTRHTTIYVTEKSAYLIVLRKITSLGAQIRRLTRDKTGKKKGSLGYPTCNGIGARDKPKSATEPRFVPTEITPSCPFKKKKLKGRKKQKLKGTHNQCVVQIDFVDGFKAPMAGEQAERKKEKQ